MNRKLVMCFECKECKTLRKVISLLDIENKNNDSYINIEDEIIKEKRFCKKNHKLDLAWAIGEWTK